MASKKTFQDIYVVKKSIRMVKKGNTGHNFDANKKLSEEKKNASIMTRKKVSDEETNDIVLLEDNKHITKNSLVFLWIICILSIFVLLLWV